MADSFQLKAIITGVDKLSPVLDGISKNVKKAGKGIKEKALMAGAFGTAWSLALAKPVKDAMDFESSMADVRKVVSFDTPEQFKQMGQDILDMSTKLPMAANDIAKIVAAGGQAGIAADGLKEFATDAVKMGIAFDESADDAGQQMAQWRVSLGMTQVQVETLADQINYLGNTGPTNAAKITDVVTRVGSLGKIAGFSAADVAALGSTIGAAGIESDVAATAIKKVFTTLASGQKMTKDQKKAMKLLHLNPKTLASDLQKNGKVALENVFTQLSKVAPEKRVAVLKSLFGEESVGAIAPLLANLELLKGNFNKVGDSAQYAGSMQKEYASRAGTTANQLELLQNNLNRVSVNVGDALLPAVNDGLNQAMPLLDKVSDFVKNNPEIIKIAASAATGLAAIGGMAAIALIVGAVGPLGIMLGSLVAAGTYIAANWSTIKDAWEHGKPMAPKPLTAEQQEVAKAFDYTKQAATPGWGLLAVQQEVANKQTGGEFLRDVKVATGRQAPTPFNRGNGPAYNYGPNTGLGMLTDGKSQIQGEMVVRFENTPPGTRVSEGKTNTPNVRMTPEVGYSPYSLMRGNH
ncbi:TPA: phage tail tape measure protein [Citrobacter farmeri]|nr:phage tail tape measure protein [Citrobacter farmeri]